MGTLFTGQIVSQWEQWIDGAEGAAGRRRWAAHHPALRGWSSASLRSPRSGPRTDAMQAALVAEAQAGCTGATLTLLVQFRPAIVSVARAMAAHPAQRGRLDEAVAEVTGTFTEVVLRHDLERRPSRIAGNLVGDLRQRITRSRPRWDELPDVEAVEDRLAVGQEIDDAAGRLDVLRAVRLALGTLRGTDDSQALTRELAFRSWILGETNAAIASDLSIAPELVRTRLCRLRSAIRTHNAQGLTTTLRTP